jgi:photosystem II stability/assembly factor-like uncharacterized protein
MAVYFTDQLTGVAIGDRGTILRTTDGGGTWTDRSFATSQELEAVEFTTASTGVAVGWNLLLRTTDGGETWNPAGTFGLLFDIYFWTSLLGVAVGEGKVIRTSDGGLSWEERPVPVTTRLYAVHGASEGVACAVGDFGVILRTTDAGESWTIQSSPTQEWLHGVYFASAMRGVACGAYERILLTTDGGTSWTIRSEGPLQQPSYHSIAMEDTFNGLAIGDGGMAARTTDGGMSWVELPRPTGSNLFGLRFQGPGRAIAVGGYGTILRYTSEIPVAVASEPGVPAGFRLCQNYPNPFNPSTTIKFELPKSSEVRLSVYDMLGREVSVLVHERREAGVHEVRFDGTNLASGVYVYRLQAGDFVQSKRMLVLK